MNITEILFFATALTMLLFSCEKENFKEAETTKSALPGGISYASVYLEDDTSILTRGVEEEERKIYNLSFYIFDADGARDMDYGYHTFHYTGNQYTFAVTAGENKTIIAAANLQEVGDLGKADLETVRQTLTSALDNRMDISIKGAGKIGETSGIQATRGDVQVIKMGMSGTYTQEAFLINTIDQ